VEVKMDMIEKDHELLGFDANQAAGVLKIRLDAMTEEIQDDFSGEVI
jgi:hypothetical protein